MSREFKDLADRIKRINVDRFNKSMAHMTRTHKEALGIHEWVDVGLVASFLKQFQKFVVEQDQRRPVEPRRG